MWYHLSHFSYQIIHKYSKQTSVLFIKFFLGILSYAGFITGYRGIIFYTPLLFWIVDIVLLRFLKITRIGGTCYGIYSLSPAPLFFLLVTYLWIIMEITLGAADDPLNTQKKYLLKFVQNTHKCNPNPRCCQQIGSLFSKANHSDNL